MATPSNLAHFLSEIAAGIGEQVEALEARHGEGEETSALRSYSSQMLAVAEATGEGDRIDWGSLVDRIGVDVDPGKPGNLLGYQSGKDLAAAMAIAGEQVERAQGLLAGRGEPQVAAFVVAIRAGGDS